MIFEEDSRCLLLNLEIFLNPFYCHSSHLRICTVRVMFSEALKCLKVFPIGHCLNEHPGGLFYRFSVQFSRSVMSDSLQPHESKHARPPCPSPTPGVHSNSHPSSIFIQFKILLNFFETFSLTGGYFITRYFGIFHICF